MTTKHTRRYQPTFVSRILADKRIASQHSARASCPCDSRFAREESLLVPTTAAFPLCGVPARHFKILPNRFTKSHHNSPDKPTRSMIGAKSAGMRPFLWSRRICLPVQSNVPASSVSTNQVYYNSLIRIASHRDEKRSSHWAKKGCANGRGRC